jgi:hypothetical protein
MRAIIQANPEPPLESGNGVCGRTPPAHPVRFGALAEVLDADATRHSNVVSRYRRRHFVGR